MVEWHSTRTQANSLRYKTKLGHYPSVSSFSDPCSIVSTMSFLQQVHHVVSVLLFDGKDSLHHAARSRIVISKILDDLTITVDGDPFSNKILPDHIRQGCAFDVFRVTSSKQAFGIQIRLAAKLHDSVRYLVGVTLLIV